MVNVAVRLLRAVGLKVTEMVQLAPPATLVPQVFVWLKSPALTPVMVIPFTARGALPALLMVTVLGELVVPIFCLTVLGELVVPIFCLPKLSELVDSDTAVPVPVRLTVCGLPAALSLTARVALLVPAAVGVNLTLMVQLEPAASVAPHVVVRVKSPLFPPVMVMLLMESVAVPVSRKVTVCAELVVPISRVLKVRDVGDKLTAEAVPVPVKLTVCGLPRALSLTVRAAVRAPVAVGVNVTLIVQLPAGASVEGLSGQLLV